MDAPPPGAACGGAPGISLWAPLLSTMRTATPLTDESGTGPHMRASALARRLSPRTPTLPPTPAVIERPLSQPRWRADRRLGRGRQRLQLLLDRGSASHGCSPPQSARDPCGHVGAAVHATDCS